MPGQQRVCGPSGPPLLVQREARAAGTGPADPPHLLRQRPHADHAGRGGRGPRGYRRQDRGGRLPGRL